jgi:heme exporter protein B
MAVERQDDAMDALLLAPTDRGAIFLGKLLVNLAMMLGMAAVVTPVGVVLFGLDVSGVLPAFVGIIAVGIVGLAGIGTLLAAAASSDHPRSGVVAMLTLPLSVPIVLTATRLMLWEIDAARGAGGAAARIAEQAGIGGSGGVGMLVAFDVIFLTAGWLAFEPAIEK